MLRILLILVVSYGLLFVLPAVYEAKPRKTANSIAALLYGLFLLPSSFVLIFLSAALIDGSGFDKYLPASVGLITVLLLASLAFTALATVPLLQIRKKMGIKRTLVVLFLATFLWDLILITLFGWLTVG